MDSLERNLLWLGVEDYTGLWQAVIEAGGSATNSMSDARKRARRAIQSLLDNNFIELFACPEPIDNETVKPIPKERNLLILEEESSWVVPGEGGVSLRFATTDRGFAVYRRETGWIGEQLWEASIVRMPPPSYG